MTLSTGPWWCAPVFAFGWITTVPAQSFSAPARAWVIAAARFMPGVCGVLVSSSSAWTTRTPWCRQRDVVIAGISFPALPSFHALAVDRVAHHHGELVDEAREAGRTGAAAAQPQRRLQGRHLEGQRRHLAHLFERLRDIGS